MFSMRCWQVEKFTCWYIFLYSWQMDGIQRVVEAVLSCLLKYSFQGVIR